VPQEDVGTRRNPSIHPMALVQMAAPEQRVLSYRLHLRQGEAGDQVARQMVLREPAEDRAVLCSGAPTPKPGIVPKWQTRSVLLLREAPDPRAQAVTRPRSIAFLRAVAQVAQEPLSP
jgi:hypothetical protein